MTSTTRLRGSFQLAPALALMTAFATATLAAEMPGWPREILVPEGRILLYQPQPDTLEGNVVKGRSALSMTPKGKSTPVFGAAWFEAKVDIDRDARLVHVLSVTIPKCRFGDSNREQEAQLAGIIEREVPNWDLTMSLDDLMAGLKAAATERAQAEGLNTDPPKIYFETEPAVLIVLDGDPLRRPIEGSKIQRVVNTPFFLVFDPATKIYWTKAGPAWFSTTDVLGNWRTFATPPAEVVQLQAKAEAEAKRNEPQIDEASLTSEERAALDRKRTDRRIPKLIVSTVPAELIVTDGEPNFKPLVGSDLLTVTNTDSDVFMEVGGQDYYLVISGRWYRARATAGPWTYVRSDKLPASFAQISPGSASGDVRTYVAGTDEAEDALIDAQIPQTAAVKRNEAKLTVQYDGDPKFEPVPNTSIRYAVNTDVSVLLIEGRYYACKDAVWFVSAAPTGPWVLADSVPAEVRQIPPESPVYNVKYVHVYDATPEVVYVGYLPGYVGCYPYYGSVVYGTGWYYRPWIGPNYYYPGPLTYGFHAHYHPWYGWTSGFGFGWGWSWGNVTIYGLGGYYGGWWGVGGYYPWPPHYYYPGYGYHGHHGYPPPPPHAGRPPAGGRPVPPAAVTRPNLYARPSSTLGQGVITRDKVPAGRLPRATRDANNVFADQDGQIFRREKSGNWQQRDRSVWKPAVTKQPTAPSARPAPAPQPKPSAPSARPAPAPRPAPTPRLDRDYRARQQSAERRMSSPGGGAGRPALPKPAAPRGK